MNKIKKGTGIPNIVIPTIRDEEVFTNFMNNWKDEFQGCHIIVVEDRQHKILDIVLRQYKGLLMIFMIGKTLIKTSEKTLGLFQDKLIVLGLMVI